MVLYAIEEVDDALSVTRDFLSSLDRWTWLKLAFVVFFIGGAGGGGGGGGNVNVPAEETPLPSDPTLPSIGAEVWLLVAGAVALLLLLGLAFMVVGSVMEFVFVESLRSGEVTIKRYWNRRWRQGLRLFGFRVAIGLGVFVAVLALLSPFLLPLFTGGDVSGFSVGAFFLLIPVFFALTLVVAIVDSFTRMFVVPIMVLEDSGVLDGWRRLWPTIRAHWKQYLVYAIAQVVLAIVAGILVAIVLLVAGLLLLIPFGIVGAVGFVLLQSIELVGWAVIAVVAILYIALMLVVAAVVQVPVQSYLRYYAMLVLGDIEETLDLIPEQRSAARGDDTAAAA